jgi:hypothetical protein
MQHCARTHCALRFQVLYNREVSHTHRRHFPAVGGDAHGRAPIFRPVITFLPSRHRNKVDRYINRRGIIGLVGFAVQGSLIRAPLDRFRVGLMAEIPARENFKNTKTSKTS